VHAPNCPATFSTSALAPQVRRAVLLALALALAMGLMGGCQSKSTDHHADGVIPFEDLRLTIDLPDRRHRFRLDGVVANMDEHQKSVVEEFGITSLPLSIEGNLSPDGRTLSWVDNQGTHWAISFILGKPDPRITSSILTHEKYHALCRLAPARLTELHDAVDALGFDIVWEKYDEEMRAFLVQIASLFGQGIPLEAIEVTGQLFQAMDVLKSSRRSEKVQTPP
jgi:hypothetical protein